MSVTELVNVETLSDEEVRLLWEAAYVQFETAEQEIAKFIWRLKKLGQANWKRDARIVDIFCGRGNGLKALELLGFTNLEGVDISAELVAHYDGPAKMHVADCRNLPLENESRDIVIVQGGLHHLPQIPEDLDRTLTEIRRVLRPDGLFVMVEPWLTPFLHLVHFASEFNFVRTASRKFDAFATMTHYEAGTYFQWLAAADTILRSLDENFIPLTRKRGFGKLHFVGKPK
jgi:SAM-dependent methyltransferase